MYFRFVAERPLMAGNSAFKSLLSVSKAAPPCCKNRNLQGKRKAGWGIIHFNQSMGGKR